MNKLSVSYSIGRAYLPRLEQVKTLRFDEIIKYLVKAPHSEYNGMDFPALLEQLEPAKARSYLQKLILADKNKCKSQSPSCRQKLSEDSRMRAH